jgi:hypothetical protein
MRRVSIETRLSKLEAISSPDGSVVFFWAMKGCQPMRVEEIESGVAARKANAPKNARVISVRWMANSRNDNVSAPLLPLSSSSQA